MSQTSANSNPTTNQNKLIRLKIRIADGQEFSIYLRPDRNMNELK